MSNSITPYSHPVVPPMGDSGRVSAVNDPQNEEAARQQQITENGPAIRLLESWLAEEATPQAQEKWERLKKVLEAHRLSYRKRFP